MFEKVVYSSEVLQFEEKGLIFKEGSECSGLWVVMSGHVSLEARIDRLDIPLKLLQPGSVINYFKLNSTQTFN